MGKRSIKLDKKSKNMIKKQINRKGLSKLQIAREMVNVETNSLISTVKLEKPSQKSELSEEKLKFELEEYFRKRIATTNRILQKWLQEPKEESDENSAEADPLQNFLKIIEMEPIQLEPLEFRDTQTTRYDTGDFYYISTSLRPTRIRFAEDGTFSTKTYGRDRTYCFNGSKIIFDSSRYMLLAANLIKKSKPMFDDFCTCLFHIQSILEASEAKFPFYTGIMLNTKSDDNEIEVLPAILIDGAPFLEDDKDSEKFDKDSEKFLEWLYNNRKLFEPILQKTATKSFSFIDNSHNIKEQEDLFNCGIKINRLSTKNSLEEFIPDLENQLPKTQVSESERTQQLKEDLLYVLELRFKNSSKDVSKIKEELDQITETEKLRDLLKMAVTVKNIQEFKVF